MARLTQQSLDSAFKQGGSATDAYENIQKRKQATAEGGLDRTAALSQLLQGKQKEHDLKQADRDAGLKAILGVRQQLPPGSNVHYGDVSVDTKDPAMLISPGQHAADTAFGKEYSDYIAGGGNENAKKNLGLLEGVEKQLSDPNAHQPNMIERGIQSLPDFARTALTPDIKAQEDQVRQAVGAGLRQTLGAAFTEKEGEAFMKRNFDPRLSPAQNLRKMQPEIAALKNQIGQKMNSSRYFEQHKGTLGGLGAATAQQAPGMQRQAPQAQPQGGTGLEHMSDEQLQQMAKQLGL